MVQRFVDEQSAYVTRYESVEQAVEHAVREPRFTARSSRTMSPDWAGETWDDAVRMAVNGDPQSARHVRDDAGAAAQIRGAVRPVMRRGYSGSAVNVGRYATGQPDCMVDTVRSRRPSPVLKVAVERAVSATVSQSDIRAVGASVLTAIESFRAAGIPLELWATFTQQTHRTLSVQVPIQLPGRAVDVDRIAFWTVNPAALRRIGFALEEQEDERVQLDAGMIDGSYGMPMRRPSGDFDEIAPSRAADVEQWLTAVFARRGVVVAKHERRG